MPSMTRYARPAFAGRPWRLAQLRRPAGQQRCGLGDVPPGGGGADAESGRQLGERLAFAQVGQYQQGLLPGVELAPRRADQPAVTADDPSGVIQGLAGQRQRGRVEKHLEPLGEMRILVDRFIYQGLRHGPRRHAVADQPTCRKA